MKIAIQGVPGSFHAIAAEKLFGSDTELVCCERFADVFASLDAGAADQALVASDNSLYGSIREVYDLLLKYPFTIIGDVTEHIHQNLIVLPGSRADMVQEIYSHPAALDQCRDYIEKHFPTAETIEHHDTAGAVQHIKTHGLKHAAAIASKAAAELYDMNILAEDIEDEKTNFTRFIILSPDPVVPIHDASKASLVLETGHTPGALHHALKAFADSGVNLTKLESRPIRGRVFHYQFFIDADMNSSQLRRVLDELQRQQCKITVLGHY
jgi:prephenate dehydratase